MNINHQNIEAYLLDYVEDRLSIGEKKQLEQFLKEHPKYQELLVDFQLITLEEPSLAFFPEKDKLYRQNEDKRTIPLYWKLAPIAAAAVFLLLALLWNPFQKTDQQLVGNKIEEKSLDGIEQAKETKQAINSNITANTNEQKEQEYFQSVVEPKNYKKGSFDTLSELNKEKATTGKTTAPESKNNRNIYTNLVIESNSKQEKGKQTNRTNAEETRIITSLNTEGREALIANQATTKESLESITEKAREHATHPESIKEGKLIQESPLTVALNTEREDPMKATESTDFEIDVLNEGEEAASSDFQEENAAPKSTRSAKVHTEKRRKNVLRLLGKKLERALVPEAFVHEERGDNKDLKVEIELERNLLKKVIRKNK